MSTISRWMAQGSLLSVPAAAALLALAQGTCGGGTPN
jgi:hypothetical protein